MAMSIKTKVAMVASLVATFTIIGLAVGNMIMNRSLSIEKALMAQADRLAAVDMILQDVNAEFEKSIKNLFKAIEGIPYEQLVDKQEIIKAVGPLVYQYREYTGVQAAYLGPVSYTHLTLPTNTVTCRSRWSPYH